ncbi:hypothetical protein JB92DRAFT_3051108 [Gautieria morchelliformis]|nr:hypothetical protein JB92DRAFT_3051108 [Gautieria morchelliformis]
MIAEATLASFLDLRPLKRHLSCSDQTPTARHSHYVLLSPCPRLHGKQDGLCWTGKKPRQIRIQMIDKGLHLQRKLSLAYIHLQACSDLIQHTALSALRLPSTGIKALTDSVMDLKTTAMTIGKTVGKLEESIIPGLTQQIEEVEELVTKLTQDMRALEDENERILGTLNAQDEDFTKLEARFNAIEERLSHRSKGRQESDGGTMAEEEADDDAKGHDNPKQRNNTLNVSVIVIL